jgi:hypothetical protein
MFGAAVGTSRWLGCPFIVSKIHRITVRLMDTSMGNNFGELCCFFLQGEDIEVAQIKV